MPLDTKVIPLNPKDPIPTFFAKEIKYTLAGDFEKVQLLKDLQTHLSDLKSMSDDERAVCKSIAFDLVVLLEKQDLIDKGLLLSDGKGNVTFNSQLPKF